MAVIERAVDDVISLVRRPVVLEEEREYREIGLRSFGNGVFHKPPVTAEEIGAKRVFRIEPGDLIFSNIFAWEGAVAVASEAERGMIGSHRFMTYRVNEEVADARYLLRYFYGGPGLDVIRRASPGSAGRNRTLGIKNFGAQRICLPDLEEQRRIADKLDGILGRIGDVSRLRETTAVLTRQHSEALLRSVEERSPLAKGLCAVDDVISLVRRPVVLEEEREYREIGLRSFGNGVFHKPPVTAEEIGAKRVFRIEPGDLIFSNIFAWEGAVAVASEAERGMIGSHRFMTYRVNEEVADARYLLRYFYGGPGLDVIRRASPGSAGRNRTLGIKNFGAQRICLPDLEEQRRIADKLTLAHSASNAGVRQLAQLASLRPALLKAAFSGQM